MYVATFELKCFRVHLYPLGEICSLLIFLPSGDLTNKMLRGGVEGKAG